MLTAIFMVLRAILLVCGGHREVALENLALRQQLMALKRTNKRPQLHRRDRLFWIVQTAGYRHIALKQPRAIPLREGASSVVPLADRAIGNLQHWLIGTYHGVSRAQPICSNCSRRPDRNM